MATRIRNVLLQELLPYLGYAETFGTGWFAIHLYGADRDVSRDYSALGEYGNTHQVLAEGDWDFNSIFVGQVEDGAQRWAFPEDLVFQPATAFVVTGWVATFAYSDEVAFGERLHSPRITVDGGATYKFRPRFDLSDHGPPCA